MGSFVVVNGTEFVTVTPDDAHPNVLHLDQDAPTTLIQIDTDTYEVRRGRWHLGDVRFCNGSVSYGWMFVPRCNSFRASRKLFPHPEAALASRRITVTQVYGVSSQQHVRGQKRP